MRAQIGAVQSDEEQQARPPGKSPPGTQQVSTQFDDAEAPVKIERRYGREVVIYYESMFEGDIQGKQWTLPMLRSIDQAYVVMRQFFGSCWYLNAYAPPKEVDLHGCGEIGGVNVGLSLDKDGAVIEWGFMD